MGSYAIVPARRVNKATVVEHMIRRFAGPGVTMTLRGDLSQVMDEIGRVEGAFCSFRPNTPPNSRQRETFCLVGYPLESLEQFPLLRNILHRVGVRHNLWEITIEKDDTQFFAVYDNWSENSGYVHEVPEDELWDLVDAGLIRHFGYWNKTTFIPVERTRAR